jgi:dual specificity protein kinase YAK1
MIGSTQSVFISYKSGQKSDDSSSTISNKCGGLNEPMGINKSSSMNSNINNINQSTTSMDDSSRPSISKSTRSKPLVLLTGNIIDLYKKCNGKLSILDSRPKRILTNPSASSASNENDNADGNLIVKVHDTIESPKGSKYSVIDLLGVGTFGQVFRCFREDTRDCVALKVIKNIPAYHHQGLLEIKIVTMLNNSYDPKNQRHIVRILDSFEFKSHVCVVFELLHSSLLDVLTQNQYRGLPLTIIQRIARQLLISLVTLQDANIIHCDLKPENILLLSKDQRIDSKPTDKMMNVNADNVNKKRENSTDSELGTT